MNQNKSVSSNGGNDSPEPIRIVMVQDVFQVGDIKFNADKIIDAAIRESQRGADLVVFPELALVGYPPEDLLLRKGFIRQAEAECERIIRTLEQGIGDTGIIFGLPVAHDDSIYNAAIYIVNGEIKQTYFKQSLPNYAVFDELRYFKAGNASAVIDVKGFSIGLLICEDVWQAASVEQTVQDGAQLVLVINASPFHIDKHDERIDVLKRSVTRFNKPVIYLNMCGGQDELVFDGDSLVMNRQAQLIARARLFEADTVEVLFDGNDVTSSHPPAEEMSGEAVI